MINHIPKGMALALGTLKFGTSICDYTTLAPRGNRIHNKPATVVSEDDHFKVVVVQFI